MRFHARCYNTTASRPWEDRVAGADEPLDCGDIDVERIVGDAMTAAETAIECAVTPLAELLAALPRVIEVEWPRRHGRRRRRAWDW